MGEYTLNISEVQILVNFPADNDGFFWHHRILLCRVEGSTWLTLTPDHEIVRHDLAAIPHRILDRSSPFPEDILDEIYAHDEIGLASLNAFKRQANTMAVILGEGTLPESESYTWVVSEPDRDDFGEEVDRFTLHNPTTGLTFSTKGVIQISGEEVYVERVQVKDLPDWKKRKLLGQADVRLLGDHKDYAGRRRLELPLAVSLMKQKRKGSRFLARVPARNFTKPWPQVLVTLSPTTLNGLDCLGCPEGQVQPLFTNLCAKFFD